MAFSSSWPAERVRILIHILILLVVHTALECVVVCRRFISVCMAPLFHPIDYLYLQPSLDICSSALVHFHIKWWYLVNFYVEWNTTASACAVFAQLCADFLLTLMKMRSSLIFCCYCYWCNCRQTTGHENFVELRICLFAICIMI